jgi:RimJ/RimL family protein N-acetyltransferase
MRNAVMVGERLYLRPLETSDADGIARGHHEETETFFESGRIPRSPIAFEQWIEQLYTHQPPEEIQLAICLKNSDEMIGIVGVGGLDWINRTGETEIYIDSAAHRGQGYGTEAKHLLLEYCFDRLQLEMLSSFIWEPNTRSAVAVLRQGYRPAGRIKTRVLQDGQFRDVLVFDVSREEWRAARAKWHARVSN